MAYLDMRDPAAAVLGFAAAPAEPAGFPRREWEIIGLARRDGLASLRAPGRLGRFVAWAFGAGINPRLADPRLEALRRVAVLAWHHGYTLPISAVKAAKVAGFSGDQVELMLAFIANARPKGRRGNAA
jgi:hypothetical protein